MLTPLENKCLYMAQKLHKDVVYGNNMVMLDQVMGTTELVHRNSELRGKRLENLVCAALLHKCFEEKRIAQGVNPLSLDDVERLAGPQVRSIVAELASEPEDKNKSKIEQWKEKAEWAKGLSSEAQEILLAEKIMNFRVSRDKPNPNKPLSWHKEYYETRMLMVDALYETNPLLHRMATQTRDEGMFKIQALQTALAKNGRDAH